MPKRTRSRRTIKTKRQLTDRQWRAAVDLLEDELKRTQTVLIQLYNDPSNMALTKMIPHVIASNRMIIAAVMNRVNEA